MNAAFKLLKEVENSGSKPIDGNTCREVIAENIRLREALGELHSLIDFDEPITDDKPMVFADATAINAAMKQARAALSHPKGTET